MGFHLNMGTEQVKGWSRLRTVVCLHVNYHSHTFPMSMQLHESRHYMVNVSEFSLVPQYHMLCVVPVYVHAYIVVPSSQPFSGRSLETKLLHWIDLGLGDSIEYTMLLYMLMKVPSILI